MLPAPRGIALVSALALAGCSSQGPRPELGTLYSALARHHHEDQNPIVVIPGILGSKLVAGPDSQVVWGAFGGGAADPQTPEGARLIALPLDPAIPVAELADEVRPAGVLDRVHVHVLGLSFELEAYANILAALGVGGYRDESLGRAGAVNYGEEHYTCFQFAYDWRRDIAASAARLHAFLLEKRAYVHRERQRRRPPAQRGRHRAEEIRFDVVAHSLGGLVLRYYLRYGPADLPADGSEPPLSWAGAALVQRASALLDERERSERNQALRSPIAWRQVTFLFSDHLGLSADPAFTDNMLYLLLEAPR